MMKLASTSDYGIRALVDLAQHEGAGPIPSSEIAARQGIPDSLVGQVLGRLRTSGFIRSTRGAHGGHQLAMPSAQIRLDQVVQALEGPIVPGACLDNAPIERCTGAAAQVRLWADVRAAILEVLNGSTVEDLAHHEAASGGRYHI